MLSTLHGAENDPEPIEGSKPSLTVYAHKIATQTNEVRSLLSSTLDQMTGKWDELRTIFQETETAFAGQKAANHEINDLIARMDSAVEKQQAMISELMQMVTSMEERQAWLTENMATLSLNMKHQTTMLEALSKDREAKPWKAPEEALAGLHKFLEHSEKQLSLETVPTLPAPTGQPPILSDSDDTERSVSVVAETPAPANKPTKKPKTAKKGKPSEQGQAAPNAAGNKAPLRKAKRHRSISLGPAIEPTPDEVLNKPSNNERDLDSQASADGKKQGVKDSAENKDQEHSTVGKEAPEETNSKKQTKKRILAGPATQEAWEMDTTTN
ncbi:hypothetical protein TWF696_001073 [Orbilia brochopaga]|uniref:Uncharacterized protein n=1 Tax=Orbilia brochopaga TaxID=3140254 RepID=A0AAV9VDN7_9PEZI